MTPEQMETDLRCLRELMDERERTHKEAITLAKEAADSAKGTVSIVGLISVAALILSVLLPILESAK